MRYLPLNDTDRGEMLAKIGASSIDDLFVDVPEVARLDGPIRDLPMHAGEMAVERHMKGLAGKNIAAGDAPFFLLSTFGGQTDLRGYPSGRYRDRMMYALQAEYRWQFNDWWVFSGFAGVGEVARRR